VTKTADAVRRHLDEPTARGLARAVGRAVSVGSLTGGERLAPIRTVATELTLSPTTVSSAWALLIRSGTIATDGRRGTVVAERVGAGPTRYRRALDRTTGFATDLSTGVPDPALLPDLGPALRRLQGVASSGSYLDAPVLPALESQLGSDWPFEAETMTVVDGAMDALDLLTASTVRYGDRVAVENPCFPPLLDLLDAVGAEAVPVDLDDDGPLPASLAAALASGATVVHLQPRAQNPTGASLTEARAAALADVLRPGSAVVIENDSAGAVATTPLVSLAERLPGRVVHIRSFSKSFGPDLRLAAVGGPARLLDPVVQRRYLGQGWSSRLLQHVLLDLLTQPDSITAVDRARLEYARRRRVVVDALARHGVAIGGRDGLNIWLPVADETAALLRLASAGIGATAGAPFAVGRGFSPYLRVTTGLLRDGHERVATELAAAATVGSWAGAR
jgi:DNA-binding transcriptional MocR family regulator